MIDKKSLSKDWIEQKRLLVSKKDPSIMESMIYALYLLEQLKLSKLDFVFKGGTSLILLLENPSRFSVDIDIIVDPSITKDEIENHLSLILKEETFLSCKLDEKRSYKEGIPKAHYSFKYKSFVPTLSRENEKVNIPEREILLDILFSENHYPKLIEVPIKTDWLLHVNEEITVLVPDINAIAGDKLTAYAPNTTGILYGKDKEKEIIKQLFDIACLFDYIDDFEIFESSFVAIALKEIEYRKVQNINSIDAILNDIIETSLLIAKRENQLNEKDKNNYAELLRGINQFNHFVYNGAFRIEDAQLASAKAAFLAANILSKSKSKIIRFNVKKAEHLTIIQHPEYNFLNKKLKFVAKGEALYYWKKTIELIR
jgi:hypothetical protein